VAIGHLSYSPATAVLHRSSDKRALIDFLADVDTAVFADGESLLKVLREGIPRFIPSDLALTTHFDRQVGRTTTVASEPAFVTFRTRHIEHWGDCLNTHPSVAYWADGGCERAMRFSDLISERDYQRLTLYNDFFRPFDVRYKLDLRLWLPGKSTIDVGFSRASGDFTEDERDLLVALQPYLQSLFVRATGTRSAAHQLRARFDLTRREVTVLVELTRGRTNPEIAQALFVSPGTIRKHLERIFRKLGVRNRTDAARQALESIADVSDMSSTLASLGLTSLHHDLVLTQRESDVLQLIRLGKSNAEAAEILSVSSSTIRRHLEHIYAKTGSHTRTEASCRPWPGSLHRLETSEQTGGQQDRYLVPPEVPGT
jgi:DNA-binding NarL/FixJ family response regulator